jgi:hypothetical protein
MGNEASLFNKESSQPHDFDSPNKTKTSCDSAILSLPTQTFEDFPNLDLLLAQPLVIGKKRLRPAISTPEDIYIEDLGKDVLVKRICINL